MGNSGRNLQIGAISFKSILEEIRSQHELDVSYNETIRHISNHFGVSSDYAKKLVDDTSMFEY